MNSNKNIVQQFWGLLKLIQRYEKHVLFYAFMKALTELLQPYLDFLFLGIFLAQLTSHHQQSLTILGIYLGLRVLITLSYRLFTKLAADSNARLGNRIDTDAGEKMLKIKYADLEDPKIRQAYQTAIEGQHYTGPIGAFVKDYATQLFSFIISLMFALATIITLTTQKSVRLSAIAQFSNSIWYGLLVVILLFIPGFIAFFAIKKTTQIQQDMITNVADSNRKFGYFAQFFFQYQNGRLIRLFHLQPFLTKIANYNKLVVQDTYYQGQLKTYHYLMLPQILSNILIGVLYLLVGAKVVVGAIALSYIVTAVGYLHQFMTTTNELVELIGYMINMIHYLQYYVDFLNLTEGQASGTLPVEKRDDNDFELAFHDVSFKYPDSNQWVLRHIDLTINVGERLAIVGKNGSGKTTLIKLLTRLFVPTEGTITLNGIDIQKYSLAEYRSLLGVVFQDFKLFAYSLAENVSANQNFDESRIWQSLDVADVKQRVTEMSDQINTPLTHNLDENGVEISGGEAQKIAIARAWYKDAPIIILDEPTAALDPISEFEIYQRFDDLIGHKTAIYISHRMSSTQFSQRIIVMDQGQIIQDGNHDTLMAVDGLYRRLFNAQSQYYTADKIAAERKTNDESFAIS